MLHQDALRAEEEAIRLTVRALPEAQRKLYFSESERRVRDPDTYAGLNYFFITGLHHFYLGHWLAGLLDLGLFGIGIALMVVGLWPFGLALILLVTVVELWALFRAQLIVQDHNNRIARAILATLPPE